MKQLGILLLFIFSIGSVYSQAKSKMVIEAIDSYSGQNEINHTPFKTTELVFPDSVFRVSISPVKQVMVVELRGFSQWTQQLSTSGKVLVYDLINRKPIWDKRINYTTQNIFPSDSILIITSKDKSEAFNLISGKREWSIHNYIYQVYPDKNLALGKYYSSGSVAASNMIVGINLNNGKLKWGRGAESLDDIDNIYLQNDSTYMLVCKGLHTFSVTDGAGWDYKMVTSKADYTSAAFSAAGILLGAFTGVYIISTGPSQVTGMISNVCHSKDTYFFAGRDKLAAIDENGIVKWEAQLPKKYMSSSNLFVNDQSLFMLNRGFADFGVGRTSVGVPFMASYERETGLRRFMVEMDKVDVILDSKIHNDTIALISDKKINLYNMEDGSKLRKGDSLDLGKKVHLVEFLDQMSCIRMKDSIWNNLIDIRPENFYVLTSDKRVIEFSPELKVLNIIPANDLYHQYFDTPQLRYLAKDENTIVINNSGKKIAEFPGNEHALTTTETIYSFKSNKIKIIKTGDLAK